MQVRRRVGQFDDKAGVVAELQFVAGHRDPRGTGLLAAERVRDEDVQCLGRADAIEHRATALQRLATRTGHFMGCDEDPCRILIRRSQSSGDGVRLLRLFDRAELVDDEVVAA